MPLDVEFIRRLRPQNTIHYFATIGSTMTEAARLAEAGSPHGTVVLADEQIAGVGRLGRSWISEPEVGIYCSILLRLAIPPAQLPVASLILGLATGEAIEQATELACDLRWPNDVLISERKVAGVLAHLGATPEPAGCIVAGIGINVNNTTLPPNVRTPATSLRLEGGNQVVAREMLIVHLLAALDRFLAMLQDEGPSQVLRAFAAASSYVANRRIVIEESGAKATTAGLDEHGFLLVRHDSGRLERLAAGGVRPVQ